MPVTEGVADAGLMHGLAVALGVGLLMGVERERHHAAAAGEALPAGVRSFALVALAGWLAGLFGVAMVVVALAATAVLAGLAYWRTSQRDPGLTSEVALLLCCLIGALAVSRPALAAGVGVIAALLLAAKGRLHRVSRELISEGELRDGLLLAAAALVVLPLLPDRSVDPLGVFNPAAVWRLVLLIMAIGALGHLALRALGERWGWWLAGFFSGLVSSTAAVASYGGKSVAGGERGAACAALAANLASLLLFVPVLAAVSAAALQALWLPLGGAAAGLLLALVMLLGPASGTQGGAAQPALAGRMFQPLQALGMAALLSAVVIAAGLVNRWLGGTAALLTAVVAGAVEVHSATATLGQLHASGALSDVALRLGLVAIIAVSATLKTLLAFGSGSRGYGRRVLAGMAGMAGGALLGALLT